MGSGVVWIQTSVESWCLTVPEALRRCAGDCGYALARSRTGEIQQGERRHHARGYCQACYRRSVHRKEQTDYRWTRTCRGPCGRRLVMPGDEPREGERKHHGKGMCHGCYLKIYGLAEPTNLRVCRECDNLMVPAQAKTLEKFARHGGHGLCRACYARERRAKCNR